MPDKDFNTIFSSRLRFFLKKASMTQAELAKRLNVGTTSVYNWCAGIKTPRMDKIDAMCDLFCCSRSELMEEMSEENKASGGYYADPETTEIAQEIFENRELRILFDAAKHAAPEDLKVAHDMLLALKKKEQGGFDA